METPCVATYFISRMAGATPVRSRNYSMEAAETNMSETLKHGHP